MYLSMIFQPGLKLCLFKHGSNQAARAPRYLTTEEVIEGIFTDKDSEYEFFDSEDDISSEEDNSNATDEIESVNELEEDEEIEQEQQTFSHD